MTDAAAALRFLRERRVLSDLDWHLARTLGEVTGESDDTVRLAIALVSRAVAQGHVCLDLSGAAGAMTIADEAGESLTVALPSRGEWELAFAPGTVIGAPESESPLVIDGGRLYTRRYWQHETDVAARIEGLCSDVDVALSPSEVAAILDRLYGGRAAATDDVDWQRVAAIVALHRRLCIVGGGPGTGKTFTVAKMLALLAEAHRAATAALPAIALVAPTGKAANRLGESMQKAAEALDCGDDVRALLRTKPMTIHRALGRRARSRSLFLRDAANPLRADVVVVDEASMVDVALMAHLLAALRPTARLILLGDRDQLSSVEAGAILADLCGDAQRAGYSPVMAARVGRAIAPAPGGAVPPLADCVVTLTRNYRYGSDSGIGRLAVAINAGDAAAVLEILESPRWPEVRLAPPADRDSGGPLERAVTVLTAAFKADDPAQRLAALAGFRVLCALRRGPFGVEHLNRQVEARLRAAGVLSEEIENYDGRPIMVVQNDAETDLFNGDVGVLVKEAEHMRAYFPSPEGVRPISLGRLPSHETVYATTVHKSQGSEFDEVAVVLPDRPSPILTRELLYTAVTRARTRVTIHASAEIIAQAVERRVERASGLRDRLWRA